MNPSKQPFFKIGDLVKGRYDYSDHLYYTIFEELPVRTPQHIGVVVSIDTEMYYFGEYIYTVLCIDGNKRFFLEDEITPL